ncbi:MAG: hypothetical protein V3R78_12555 [Thermodesulfobacteriota bacterium]
MTNIRDAISKAIADYDLAQTRSRVASGLAKDSWIAADKATIFSDTLRAAAKEAKDDAKDAKDDAKDAHQQLIDTTRRLIDREVKNG